MDSRLMVHRPAVRAMCGVHARVGDLAKHGSRDRPADWQQDNKQQQERKANSFHGQQVSTHEDNDLWSTGFERKRSRASLKAQS